jgi:hypothetical protein
MAKRYYESKEEKRDFNMLGYDHSAVANMPQTVKYHDWPSSEKYVGNAVPELDDTIRGINKQMGEDVSGAKKHRSHAKY